MNTCNNSFAEEFEMTSFGVNCYTLHEPFKTPKDRRIFFIRVAEKSDGLLFQREATAVKAIDKSGMVVGSWKCR